MNSHNLYHLSFNPRGAKPRAEKQTRYVPQLKQKAPWRQGGEYEDIGQGHHAPAETREFKIPLSPNDSGYMSNKSTAGRRGEEISKREEQRKKEQIIKRVKELQEKVLPMVDRQHHQDQQGPQTGWQSRVQLKLVRLQTCLDAVRKQWQVQMQKKLAEIESQWQSRMQQLLSRTQR